MTRGFTSRELAGVNGDGGGFHDLSFAKYAAHFCKVTLLLGVRTSRRIEQMLAALVGVPSLRLAVLATPQTRLRDGFTRTIELAAPMIGAQQILANELPGDFGLAARALASWMARANWASTPLEARLGACRSWRSSTAGGLRPSPSRRCC
jgi:hypothetical protein